MVTSKSAEVGDRILKVTFCFILMEEIWKDVVGYEGLYQVSNLGKVKSSQRIAKFGRGTRIAPSTILANANCLGYKVVTLFKNGVKRTSRVHRLVAEAFLPNPNNFPQVNHKDGNKSNNLIYVNDDGKIDFEKSNLEWCSASYNIKHAYRVGLKKPHSNGFDRPVLCYDTEGNFVKEFPSESIAAKELGLRKDCISRVAKGKYKKTKNFIFKFKQ